MKRRGVIILIVIVVIILIGISVWLIYKKYLKKDSSNEGEVYNPNDIYIPNVGGAGSGGFSSLSFPIKKGMGGQEVINIQTAINKKCNKNLTTDGKFGPLTESALKSCYGSTTVSQALYTQMKFDTGSSSTGCKEGEYKGPFGCTPISGGTTPPPSSALSKGNMVYAKIPTILLYKNPDGSTSFGKIASSQNLNNPIGSYLSSYKEFSEIMVTTNYTGVTGGSIQSTPVRAFVYTSLIKK
jgi:peptidoglycan hydrolase-like protein with peptidoglycan-binding domain